MGGQSDETERTIVFADIALSQIRALGHSAEPRNYEIWYHYATGYNPALNKTINETIERKGRLDAADLDAIRERFVGANRLNQEIEQFGNKVADEIEQIMGMVGTAVGSATSYSETLADASVEIGNATDGDGLRVIVEGLIKTTKEIESANNSLEERLKASHQEIQDLRESLEVVRHESLTDPLTALSNRKYFDQSLSRMSMRDNAPPMSLLMIDVDHFKAFNDTFGHLTGDQVLRLVAQCIKQNVKGQDIAARYGGEEFGIILPSTSIKDAATVADHVRRAVMSKELRKRSTGESLGRVTVSVGCAGWCLGDTPQTLIERADACLYAAKRAGRNRVVHDVEAGIIATHSRVA